MPGQVTHRAARACPAHGAASGAVDNLTSAKPHLTKSNSCPTKRGHLCLRSLICAIAHLDKELLWRKNGATAHNWRTKKGQHAAGPRILWLPDLDSNQGPAD
jgi:hypothetical protein